MKDEQKEVKSNSKMLKALTTLLILIFSLASATAQTMYVNQDNGTQTNYGLSNIRKITFANSNATIQKTDYTTDVYFLNRLKYFNFEDLTINIEEQPMQLDNPQLLTYPNPTGDFLNLDLRGIEGAGTLNILTLDGKVLQTQQTNYNSWEIVNLSQLSQGIYICQYINTSTHLTVKIIKQ